MKKILVSGGAGYVGSALVDKLIEKGYKVRVFDKGYFDLDHVNEKAEVVRGDIRQPSGAIFKGIDTVIHLAAFSNDPTADYDPAANWKMNKEGTEAMASIAKMEGVKRFIDASTCSLYYQTGKIPKETFDEESELNCKAPYPASKQAAEKVLEALHDKDFQVITLRKGTIYGKSPKMRYDLVLNTFVKDAFLKGEIRIHAEGKLWRPITSLTEVVDVYCKMIEAPIEKVGGQTFNVVGENIKIIDLAGRIYKALLEKRNIRIKLDIWRHDQGIIRSYKVSNEKLDKLFPKREKQSIEDAVVEIWDNLVTTYNPEDCKYDNIRNLEELKRYEDKLKQLGSVL
jgi:nucleoside-diphosphate-sugar epimerase